MENELTKLIDEMLDHMPPHPLNRMTYIGKGYNKQQMLDTLYKLRDISSKYKIEILFAKEHTPENKAHNEMVKRIMNEKAI